MEIEGQPSGSLGNRVEKSDDDPQLGSLNQMASQDLQSSGHSQKELYMSQVNVNSYNDDMQLNWFLSSIDEDSFKDEYGKLNIIDFYPKVLSAINFTIKLSDIDRLKNLDRLI